MAENIELDISLGALKQGLADLKEEFKDVGKVGDTAFGTVGEEVTALTKEMQDLLAVQREVGVDTKKLEGASAGLSTRIKGAVRDFQIGGKSVGEYADQFSGLVSKMGLTQKAIGGVNAASKILKVALAATGIGALVAVVGSAIAYFTRFQSAMDTVSKITASVSAVIGVLADRLAILGSAVASFFSGNFTEAFDDLKLSVTGLGDAISLTASKAYELEKQFQQLRDESLKTEVLYARQAIQIQKLKDLADDSAISDGKRMAAAKLAATQELELGEKLLNQERAFTENLIDKQLTQKAILTDLIRGGADEAKIAAQRNLAEKEFAELSINDKKLINDAEIKLFESTEANNKAKDDNEKRILELQKEAAAERKKIRDKEAGDEKKRAELRVAVISDEYEKQIAAEQLRYERLLADLNKFFKGRAELLGLIEQAEKQHQNNIADIFLGQAEDAQKRLEELQKLRAARDEFEKESNKKNLDAAKKNIEDIRKLQDSEIDVTEQNFNNYIAVLEASGVSKEKVAAKQLEFDKLIESERIRVAIEAQESLLAITADGDANQVELIKNKIALLKSQLEGISIAPAKDKKKGNFLLDALGIGPEDEDNFKRAVSEAIKGIELLNAARLQAAQVAVEAANEQVTASQDNVVAAQEALDQELELAALGFASDVTNKKAELDLANQAAADAKVRQEKALEDQKKLQKQQLAIDAVTQAANIALSISNLVRTWSTLPFGVGLIAAFGQAAGLLAFIASTKAKAKALSARDGAHGRVGRDGVVVGNSHSDDGVPLTIEGGEFFGTDGKRFGVVSKKMTSAHFGLLQAINSDNRPAMAGYLERLTGGVSRSAESTGSVAAQSSGSYVGGTVIVRTLEVEKLLSENNRLTQKLLDAENNKESIVDMGDHFLRRQKGRTEIIKKRG